MALECSGLLADDRKCTTVYGNRSRNHADSRGGNMVRIPAAMAMSLALLLAPCITQAAEPTAANDHGDFVRLPNFDEFIVGMCSRSRATLLDELRKRRSALDARRLVLSDEAGDGNLNAQDIVLTILLPGGLIYAAHRHDVIHRAQLRLRAVEARMEEINAELHTLTPAETLTASVK